MKNETNSVIERTLSPTTVNVVGTILTAALFILVLGAYTLLWHDNPLAIYTQSDSLILTLVLSLLVFFISIIIHELLHALGYWLGGAARSDIHIGFQWQALMPYAHCKVPLRANAYKFAVALPGLILGIIPALLGIVTHSDGLMLYGAAMLSGAIGDLMILALLLPLDGQALILDHPSLPGFQIVVQDNKL